jgi:hypothetical protein
MPLKNDWVNGDLFTPAAANDMANVVNAAGSATARNVKDYGATGDGTSNDTAAIHSARDAVGVGGKLFFPSGTYLVSGLTASVANQSWELADNAIIKSTASQTNLFFITGNGVTVTGGIFDYSLGTLHDGSQHGVRIQGDDVSVRGITVRDSPWYGIEIYRKSRIAISGCTITNSWAIGIWFQNDQAGPSEFYDISITDNFVDVSSGSNETSGIGVRGESATQTVSRVNVSGNTIVLKANPSAETAGVYVNRSSDYVVANNVVIGGAFGLSCPFAKRATFANNVARGFNSHGIELASNQDDVTVVGNVLDSDGNSAANGIWTSAGNINNLTISGNTIRGCNVPLDFSSGSVMERVSITGNILTSSASVARVIQFNGTPTTSLTISGNVIDGTTSPNSNGVEFLRGGITGVTITGNHFTNLTGQAVGLFATSGAIDHIKMTGNSYVNCPSVLVRGTSGTATIGSNIVTEYSGGFTTTATAAGTRL